MTNELLDKISTEVHELTKSLELTHDQFDQSMNWVEFRTKTVEQNYKMIEDDLLDLHYVVSKILIWTSSHN